MKKQLLSTSAIALGVAAAAPAAAQDWNLDWGGYMNQHVAIADVGGTATAAADLDGLGFLSNSEIIFSPSITLDNGLTFGVNVQFEAENGGGGADGIDETYMTISGDSFGRVVLGSENSAGYVSMVAAPQVTSMAINSPSISAFIPVAVSFRQAGGSAYTEVAGNNDVDRISYFTPNFNGLALGVSYARNNGGNAVGSHNNSAGATVEDIIDVGVNYSGTIGGGVDLNFGARWGQGDVVAMGGGSVDTWGVGATVGFNGFTIGGHYAENDNGTLAADQEGWSFGASYDAPGPWSFALHTFQGEVDGNGTGGADTEYTGYQLGARRAMGPGVSWDLYAVIADQNDKGLAGTEIDGTVFGTAINLSF